MNIKSFKAQKTLSKGRKSMNDERTEQKNNDEKKEKKRKLLIIFLFIGIVICIALTVWALFFREGEQLIPDYAPKETEANAVPVSGDDSTLDVPQGGGGISIEYTSSVTVSLSENKAYLQYTHPKKSTQNIVLCIMVKDTVIAKSGLIVPGNRVSELNLLDGAAKKLSAGTYTDAKFKILSYDPETGEKSMVDTEAKITVTVKE